MFKRVWVLSVVSCVLVFCFVFAVQAEEVTLVYSDWHLVEPVWEKSLKEAFAEFQQMYPNIKITLDPVSLADKTTKYATAMTAGRGPDIVHLQAHAELYAFMSRGYLLDITPYVTREDADFLSIWSQDILSVCQKDGQYYCLPGDLDPMLLVYNTKLFQDAGLDPNEPPKTWDEFLAYAQQLTMDINSDGTNDIWAFTFPGSISSSFQLRFMPFLYSFGADVIASDCKCCTLNTPEAKEAFQFVVDLETKHRVMAPGVAAMGAGQCRELMAFEKVAMLIEGPWALSIIDDLNPQLGAHDVLRAASVPVKSDYTGQSRTTAELTTWAINANTEYPDESWLLIKFLTSKPIQEKFWRDNYVIPSRLDISGGDKYSPNPELAEDIYWSMVFAQELPYVKIVPQMEEWPEIIELVNVATQEAWTQQKTAMDALRDAYEAINRLLISYRLPGEKCPLFQE